MALSNPDPDLTDGIVVLRPWSVADLGCVKEASREGRVPEGTSVPERFTEESGRAWIRRQQERARAGQGWSLAIGDARTAKALGCAVLMLRPRVGVAGIGYWLVPGARGRGYATRAVGLLAAWGLEEQGLDGIEAWVEPGNDASARVLSRCGFDYRGQLPFALRFATRQADALVFARTREAGPAGYS